jgi:hypothetical protein
MRWPADESHPRTLGIDDLPAMLESDALFARKFDPAVDAEILARLTERVVA